MPHPNPIRAAKSTLPRLGVMLLGGCDAGPAEQPLHPVRTMTKPEMVAASQDLATIGQASGTGSIQSPYGDFTPVNVLIFQDPVFQSAWALYQRKSDLHCTFFSLSRYPYPGLDQT
jgi:hypothetical protein